MLIATQQGNAVVNLDNMEAVFAEPENAHIKIGHSIIFARGATGKSVALGKYLNEARAKEVLQEIVAHITTAPNVVYEMPRE